MSKVSGAPAVAGTGSCPAGQAPTGLDASRCDPARVDSDLLSRLLEIERAVLAGISIGFDWEGYGAQADRVRALEKLFQEQPQ